MDDASAVETLSAYSGILAPPDVPGRSGAAIHSGSSGERALQEKYGTISRANAFYNHQVLDHLNSLMQDFISRQEMVFIGTANGQGFCDCSLRAGPAGFVRVLDERHIAYPEYRGNGVMASLSNIAENPSVGMFFVDFFGSTVGLHVNGSARIIDVEEVASPPSRFWSDIITREPTGISPRPERWVIIEVQEAFIHCSKHVPLLQKLDKGIHWGTDNVACKGGDYFQAKKAKRLSEELAGSEGKQATGLEG